MIKVIDFFHAEVIAEQRSRRVKLHKKVPVLNSLLFLEQRNRVGRI